MFPPATGIPKKKTPPTGGTINPDAMTNGGGAPLEADTQPDAMTNSVGVPTNKAGASPVADTSPGMMTNSVSQDAIGGTQLPTAAKPTADATAAPGAAPVLYAGGAGGSTAAATPAAPAAPTGPAPIPTGHVEGSTPANWSALGISPDRATQDMPVPGHPGQVLHHNGYGWEVVTQAAAAAPTPTVSPTTPPAGGGTPESPAPAAPPTGYTGPAAGTPEGPPVAGKPADATPPPPDPQTTAYKTALLRMLDQASTPATLEDPALKAQSDAAAVGLQRSTDAGRAALAERMAQQGGAGVDSGAFNSDLAGLFNQQGEQQAGINAGLVGDANKAKVQQLQSALTMMGSDINSEQGRALTKELAQAQLAEGAKEFEQNFGLEGKKLAETIRQFDTSTQAGKDAAAQQLLMFKQQMAEQGREFDVDAAMKKLGIDTQASLGGSDLALRDKLGTGGLNAQILQMLMQNQQFGQGLGAQLGMFNQTQGNANLQALLQQLGG